MAMQKSFVKEILERLRAQESITSAQYESLISSFQGNSRLEFETFLLEEGFVVREALLKALADFYAVPSFDASGYFFDHRLVTVIPKELLLAHGFIPYLLEEESMLMVVASVPTDLLISEICGRYTPWDVRPLVGLHQDILDAIEEYYDDALTMSDSGELLQQQDRDQQEALEAITEDLERRGRSDFDED